MAVAGGDEGHSLAGPVAFGGLWVFLFAMQLRKHPLVPVNDPYFRNMVANPQGGGH